MTDAPADAPSDTLDLAADPTVGSAIPVTPDASNPAPLNPAPPEDDPFADDKGGAVLAPAETPLLERMRLHFKQAQIKGGPFGAFSHFGQATVARRALERGNPSDLENEVIDTAAKAREDLAAYDRMPGSEGFLDYGSAILGEIAGGASDPTSLISGVKIPFLAARGVFGRIAEFGVNQAAIQTGLDPVIQGLNIASKDNTRDDYSLFQTLVEKPIGGLVVGGLLKGAHEVGSALFIRPQAEQDALRFFQAMRDHATAEDIKRAPEIVEAVQGKSDQELGEIAKEATSPAGDNAKPETPTAPDKPATAPDFNPDFGKLSGSEGLREAGAGGDPNREPGVGAEATGTGEQASRLKEGASAAHDAGQLGAGNEAIGDVLASEANHDALHVAVRPMEGSLQRAHSSLTRGSLTSNLVEAPNLRTLWTTLARELGATVRPGRMQGRTAAGQYFIKSGVIRMRQLDDLTVLAHELGHHVEVEYGLANLMKTAGSELDGISAYASSFVGKPKLMRKEGFAEFFRLFIEHPAEAQRRAPNFFTEFTKFVDAKPELKATLENAQRGFDSYRMANAADLVYANIQTGVEPKGWAKLRQDVRNNGIWNTIAERGSQIYSGLLDQHNPLAHMVQDLLKVQKANSGKTISLIAADDPYKLTRLASNDYQAGHIDLQHGVVPYHSITPEGPSISDAISLATGKPNILSGWDEAAVNKFDGYLIARRGVFEWGRRERGELDREPMPFPKDVYQEQIRQYEAENKNAREAATMVHTWAHNELKKELDAGLITPDSYNKALAVEDYVPLMRDMSDKTNQGGGNAFDATNVGLKQFRGSSRPIISPIRSLMERAYNTAQLIAHNDAITALAALADKAGPGGGEFVERISSQEMKARFVNPLEALRKGLSDAGAATVDADLAISNMLNDLKIGEQDIGPVSIFRPQTTGRKGENVVFYLSGGELKALRLKDGDIGREVVKSLTDGMSTPLRDWNLRGLATASKVLRAGVTTDPTFLISNTIRDQLSTWILNRGTFPVIDAVRGVYREITNDELSRAFAQMGGIAGGANLNALDHARVDRDIQALSSKGFTIARLASWEGYFKAIEISETASRQGLFGVAYKRARKQGLDQHQAAVEAAFTANDNLDFGRHGSAIGDTIKLVPFMNAQLQGVDKAWRTLVTPLFKKALTEQDKEARWTLVSAYTKITALTGLSMALRGAYLDDPEYSELSPYMRNTHWMVRVPGFKDGKVVDAFGRTVEVPPGLRSLWVAIPKPFELAILPNLGERAVEMFYNKDPKALARWLWGAKDLVASKWMMDSVGIKLAAEMMTGKDTFTGRDIEPEQVAGNDPWARATAGTSQVAKSVGEAVDKAERALGLDGGGISPMYVDHIIKGVGGTWGRTFLSLSDAAFGTKGDQSLADTAITQRFFKEAYRGSTSGQEFWGAVARTNGAYSQAANTYDSLASNPAAQANYVARLPEDKRVWVIMNKSEFSADEKRLHPMYRAHEAVSLLSNMKREIANDAFSSAATLDPIPLTNSEKRVALDSLSRIQMWEARNALITSGNPALKDQKPGNVDAEIEMLAATVPAVHDELAQRYANTKIYKADEVASHWDEVRQSVVEDGSSAQLKPISREVQRAGFELDERQNKKKKVKPQIPGTMTAQ